MRVCMCVCVFTRLPRWLWNCFFLFYSWDVCCKNRIGQQTARGVFWDQNQHVSLIPPAGPSSGNSTMVLYCQMDWQVGNVPTTYLILISSCVQEVWCGFLLLHVSNPCTLTKTVMYFIHGVLSLSLFCHSACFWLEPHNLCAVCRMLQQENPNRCILCFIAPNVSK